MFDTERIEQLARELNQSKNTRTPLAQFTQRYPDISLEDGYKISRAWIAIQQAEGRSVIGHKIGLTSKVFDTISDNAANAGIIIGAEKIAPEKLDLPWCGAILSQNGVVEETGLAAGVQGHPAIGVAWLANKLAPWGETLQPGQIVLAGSFTRPVAAKVGDVFKADYGPMGQLNFRFV